MKLLYNLTKQIACRNYFNFFSKQSCFHKISCSKFSSYWQAINPNEFSTYLKFLQKLNNDMNEHSSFVWPENLLQELGPNQNQAKSKLTSVAAYGETLKNIEQSLKDVDQLSKEICLNDKEMISEIEIEKENLNNKITEILNKALDFFTTELQSTQFAGFHLKIEPGVGGNEAAIFASELYEMYRTLCLNHGLQLEEREYLTSENGIFLKVSAYIPNNGEPTLNWLVYEGGTHRVQRVPETEAHGRLHTSTVSIGVIPEYTSTYEPLDKNDLKIIFGKSSKPGGQNVNKRLTQVILTHIPTKMQVKCEDSRNAIQNRDIALAKLTEMVHSKTLNKKDAAMNRSRKRQMTHRNRSDKIRTYNFPKDRVTDHRIGLTVHGTRSVINAGKQLETLLDSVGNHFLFLEKVDILNTLMKEAIDFNKN